MKDDFIDHLVAQWNETRPDLNASPMFLVARLARIGTLLERRLSEGLEAHGLTVWEFDVLASLRRNDSAGLPPKRLLEEILLTSGAMTNRIDRLEESGYVERRPDPDDRRGVIVRLTRKGRAVVDPAVEDRFEDARRVAAILSRRECEEMIASMKKLLVELEKEEIE